MARRRSGHSGARGRGRTALERAGAVAGVALAGGGGYFAGKSRPRHVMFHSPFTGATKVAKFIRPIEVNAAKPLIAGIHHPPPLL